MQENVWVICASSSMWLSTWIVVIHLLYRRTHSNMCVRARRNNNRGLSNIHKPEWRHTKKSHLVRLCVIVFYAFSAFDRCILCCMCAKWTKYVNMYWVSQLERISQRNRYAKYDIQQDYLQNVLVSASKDHEKYWFYTDCCDVWRTPPTRVTRIRFMAVSTLSDEMTPCTNRAIHTTHIVVFIFFLILILLQ